MGGQRSMALLIEHLDRRVIAPLAICPGPGALTDHLTALDCPVFHVPLHPIKPRTLPRVWRAARRIRTLLRERAIDFLAPDAPRDALTCGLAKLGTSTKLVWLVRMTARDPLDPILERLADGLIGDSDATRERFSRTRLVSGSHQDTEGMSRVLYEGMACGAVPVATDIRGNRDAVTPDTGLLVPERSPADLARALTLLLAHPQRLAELRAAGAQRVQNAF